VKASRVAAVLSSAVLPGQGAADDPPAALIRRLDGSTLSTAAAETFARETLAAARVTGAQIAVLDRGRLVSSAAFGLRRREPQLPMDRETTTWRRRSPRECSRPT
jgi:CubicO group peptidase (beta-lactamase class C family)